MVPNLQRWRQQWKAEGRAEGKAEGKAEGRAEGTASALTRLLERRFGPLPEDIAGRIRIADEATLRAWFDLAIDAPDLATVFPSEH